MSNVTRKKIIETLTAGLAKAVSVKSNSASRRIVGEVISFMASHGVTRTELRKAQRNVEAITFGGTK